MLSPQELVSTGRQGLGLWQVESRGLDKLDRYFRGDHDGPYTPREANREYRLLTERSRTNWLPLVVSAVAQSLYVEGYARGDQMDNAAAWDYWQANGLDHRQGAVHRAALTFGHAYVTVLPGDTSPVIRGVSPRKMVALYDDPSQDDWPVAAVRVGRSADKERPWRLEVWDDTHIHRFDADDKFESVSSPSSQEHGLGVCPVVRFVNLMDLDGRTTGELEPLIDLQDRINQTAFDLLMTQTFASFKIRTVSGMTLSEDDDEARSEKLKIAQDRFLVAEDQDTKFGVLDETPLGGFIDALDQSVRHMAAVSQTPPHHLLGQMANLSAEALAAADVAQSRKVDERKKSLGESWEQVLRLASAAAGDDAGAADVSAQVKWRDTEARSFSATVDALGKASQMLQIPARGLWDKIPGVSQQDVERWVELQSRGDAFATLSSILERQQDDV